MFIIVTTKNLAFGHYGICSAGCEDTVEPKTKEDVQFFQKSCESVLVGKFAKFDAEFLSQNGYAGVNFELSNSSYWRASEIRLALDASSVVIHPNNINKNKLAFDRYLLDLSQQSGRKDFQNKVFNPGNLDTLIDEADAFFKMEYFRFGGVNELHQDLIVNYEYEYVILTESGFKPPLRFTGLLSGFLVLPKKVFDLYKLRDFDGWGFCKKKKSLAKRVKIDFDNITQESIKKALKEKHDE